MILYFLLLSQTLCEIFALITLTCDYIVNLADLFSFKIKLFLNDWGWWKLFLFCVTYYLVNHSKFVPVQTQGTQLLKLFIQLYYTNSHQQYENKVSHSLMFTISMFTNQHVNQYSHNRQKMQIVTN